MVQCPLWTLFLITETLTFTGSRKRLSRSGKVMAGGWPRIQCTNQGTNFFPYGQIVLQVAAGGIDGVLQVFSFKKGEIQMIFKTLPSEKISSLELGGPLGLYSISYLRYFTTIFILFLTDMQCIYVGGLQDKIFVSTKNEVRGYTKKGKVFLGFDTNLTESINSM